MRGAFSVGETGAGADVVVDVVVVVSGAFSSSLEQPAVKAPMAMTAPMPTTAASCRGRRFSSVMF
ncbi:hypothetical protein BHQ17_08075 [Mycolicibacterium holsaticum]|jgi:hypothetical protein|uniref:Uncharacterized protein n=1 Tax=Mycolicibacterium holsaticum TaxID=152142 RepID=A0A1E3RY16_9MYCO|nr:hypothetical protein [Mycolicibacterium holsaticum DSM 44478 = JCM 12374]ODQ94739.1 hypothetical protein BHQ17_08075 [Mycolicibacterium holsaticum]